MKYRIFITGLLLSINFALTSCQVLDDLVQDKVTTVSKTVHADGAVTETTTTVPVPEQQVLEPFDAAELSIMKKYFPQ